MQLTTSLADFRLSRSPARRARQQRHALFLDLLRPLPRPVRILDVGGTEDYWRVLGLPEGLEVVALNLEGGGESHTPRVRLARGDACDLSAYADGAFDVAFSNSVIEHVGPLADVQRVAGEIVRVGRAYFVQTPNRRFPIEPHFLVPGFQWLPCPARAWILTHARLGWGATAHDADEARRMVESVRLLDRHQLQALFPGATIWEERWCGLVKSLVAYGGFGPTRRR